MDSECVDTESNQFTPIKTAPTDSSPFAGVRISSFERDTDYGLIMDFLINAGLPESCKDNVIIKENGTVFIESLENEICCELIEAIHDKPLIGNRKLYCNGVIPRTPDKTADQGQNDQLIQIDNNQLNDPFSVSGSVPVPVSPMSPNTFSQQYLETPDLNFLQITGEDLARRNSLSLRSPPPGSLGDELLACDSRKHFTKAKSILSNIKEMADKFSDFASCESFSDDETGSNNRISNDGFQLQGKKKRGRKHRLSPSPNKEYFLKKQNVLRTPENKKSEASKETAETII